MLEGGTADPAPKSKPLLCAAWACSDVRSEFGAIFLAEPDGPPALSTASGVVGGHGRRRGPPAAVQATSPAPARGGDDSSRGGTAASDGAAARAASLELRPATVRN